MLGFDLCTICIFYFCTEEVKCNENTDCKIFFQVPTASTYVDGNPALNRVSWTNSGQQITVGDDMGKIWIYDVGEVSNSVLYKFSISIVIK